MKKPDKNYRRVLFNFDVKNIKEYGITVIGNPMNETSYPVMNFSTKFVKSYITGLINRATDDEVIQLLQSRIDSLPVNDVILPFKVTIHKNEFNKLHIKVPMNILPRLIPSGEITMNSVYRMVSEPAYFVVSKNILYNIPPLNGVVEQVSSRSPILGIPTKFTSQDPDSNIFDCEIQLDELSVTSLIANEGLEIGDVSEFKTRKRGVKP